MPTRRGSRCVPAGPRQQTDLDLGNPTAAVGLSASTRWWQASASSKPPPIAAPLIAATTGLPQVSRRRKARDSEPYFEQHLDRVVGGLVEVGLHHQQVGAGDEGLPCPR